MSFPRLLPRAGLAGLAGVAAVCVLAAGTNAADRPPAPPAQPHLQPSYRAGDALHPAALAPATIAPSATISVASARPAGTAAAAAAAVIPRLTARQLAGQRVIYSYGGLTPPAALLTRIRHGEAAGVIFFAGNIASVAQLAGVAKELERANASRLNPVRSPLLLMTDQEGGQVRRLAGQPPYLSEKQIGAAAHPEQQAVIAGRSAATALRGAGLNLNLAPVVDVYRRQGNFIDRFGRSYSGNPRLVSYVGAAFIKAQQQGGVAATAKHFPGLGAAATNQDTDAAPVTIRLPASEIRAVDERPYRSDIAAGVRLIMVSWAVYPALDSRRPAGLSPVIVQGDLRQRLGFRGVTITDALEAGALRPFGSIASRSLLAAGAGMDLLLCAQQNAGEGDQAASALTAGYQDGRLGRPAFLASVARNLILRASQPG